MRLIVENKMHEKLELTNNPNYAITSVSGLNPTPAGINTSRLATSDGTIYNSSFVNQKNIVITIYIMRSIEKNRIALYKFFKTKQYVKLYFSNDTRDVFIEGFVETFDGDLFSMSQNFQISIICPSPFFSALKETKTTLNNIDSGFSFPFSIAEAGIPFSELNDINLANVINAGDVESGLIIDMYSTGRVVNPKIHNADTGEFFGLNYTIESGNTVRIITQKGKKSVKLLTYGVERNLINYVAENSVWLQLDIGSNTFTVTADEGKAALNTTIYHTNLFEGV